MEGIKGVAVIRKKQQATSSNPQQRGLACGRCVAVIGPSVGGQDLLWESDGLGSRQKRK
jgi:hypothetical protein